ncbi:MAG: hypothetical protein ACYDBJ_17955 [Aggregatilineales bacterium]
MRRTLSSRSSALTGQTESATRRQQQALGALLQAHRRLRASALAGYSGAIKSGSPIKPPGAAVWQTTADDQTLTLAKYASILAMMRLALRGSNFQLIHSTGSRSFLL